MQLRGADAMGKIRQIAIAVLSAAVCAAWLCHLALPAAAVSPEVEFRHGIGMSHVMAWAAIEPRSAGQFVYPPFANVSDAQFSTELRTLRRSGFDFVRLAVDPGPFLQFGGSRRDELDRVLSDRVNLILASGLSVAIDFHPSDMQPEYTAQALTAGPQTAVFQSYLQLLRRTAALLGRFQSNRVALELMNEPPVSPGLWQPMLEAAYAAARSGSTVLPLILEGGNEASAPALMKMRTTTFADDAAVLYSFHYYEPYQFTHQGASWNPARYLADVPYPAVARPLDDSLTATAAAIAATDLSAPMKSLAYQDAQARLEDYRASAFDDATIKANFDQIAHWAQSRGILPSRIMLGEFGARKTALQFAGARARERAEWFHDVRQAAEANGFGWAVWAYRGGGFAVARSNTDSELEPDIADALGLSTGVPGKAEALPKAATLRPVP
jgi:endoglucanase